MLNLTNDKNSNTYNRTIKMKPVSVNDSIYIDDKVKSNDKDPEFKASDRVRIMKYENIFCKRLHSKLVRKSFCYQKNLKNTVPQAYVISDLNCKEIVGTVYEKELQRTNQAEFKVEKVIRKVINYISTGKVTIICLIVRLIKKMFLYNMSLYFPPYEKVGRIT